MTTEGVLGLELGLTTGGILGLELVAIHRGDDWRDTAVLGLELVAIHRDDDWRDAGARTSGYTKE